MDEIKTIKQILKNYYAFCLILVVIAGVILVLMQKASWTVGLMLGLLSSWLSSIRLINDSLKAVENNDKIQPIYSFGIRMGIFIVALGLAFIIPWINQWVTIIAVVVIHIGYIFYMGIKTAKMVETNEGANR